MKQIIELLPVIIISIETILRLFPTTKNYSPLHNVLKALLSVSSVLNNKKSQANSAYAKQQNEKINRLRFLFIFTIAVSVFSCKALQQVQCKNTKYVDVTFVMKDSSVYTVAVPYCDTIILNNKKAPKEFPKPIAQ